jgi:hypothetical protein
MTSACHKLHGGLGFRVSGLEFRVQPLAPSFFAILARCFAGPSFRIFSHNTTFHGGSMRGATRAQAQH